MQQLLPFINMSYYKVSLDKSTKSKTEDDKKTF